MQVLKLVVINDCGTVMYASGAEAQQVGGQVMGVGEALTEEIVYDPVRGVPLNFNFIDYKIPTMADMPDIDPVLLEVWRGAGEYGACGIGEGHRDLHPTGHRQRGVQCHRCPGRRHPDHAGKSPAGLGPDLR